MKTDLFLHSELSIVGCHILVLLINPYVYTLKYYKVLYYIDLYKHCGIARVKKSVVGFLKQDFSASRFQSMLEEIVSFSKMSYIRAASLFASYFPRMLKLNFGNSEFTQNSQKRHYWKLKYFRKLILDSSIADIDFFSWEKRERPFQKGWWKITLLIVVFKLPDGKHNWRIFTWFQ